MHLEECDYSTSQQTVMSEKEDTHRAIHLKVPTGIQMDTIKRRGMFAKRDKKEASSRRLLIADAVDDVLYPPPAPVRPAQRHTPLARDIKSAEPSEIDESGRSFVSELTLDASGKTEIDVSARTIDASTRTEPSSNVKQKKSPKSPKSPTTKVKTPKQKTKKSSKSKKAASDDEADEDMSVITSTSDELSVISEKRSTTNSSSRSISSKSSKNSTTKKKKTQNSRRASMKSLGSCESIDELTVTSGEMSFEGLSIADSITADSGSADAPVSARSAATTDSARRSQPKKKPTLSRRGSTGDLSKSSKKSKGSKKSSKESIPMIVGSCCGESDEVSASEEKPPSLMNSTLSECGGVSEPAPQESAVLSQGLKALGRFYE